MKNIGNYRITLASASPRRRKLLEGLDLDFTVEISPGDERTYGKGLPPEEMPAAIASGKSMNFHRALSADEILITADTMVIVDGIPLGKPEGRQGAVNMLRMLSGRSHKVVTGVCLRSIRGSRTFSCTTEVTFRDLEEDEIAYYVDNYKPYDKAGAYGIQEWIGYIGITGISGSYFNIVGLPVQRLYKELSDFTCI